MAIKTFVELIERPAPAEPCSWAECQATATVRLHRWDTRTQTRRNASRRPLCDRHGIEIQEMLNQLHPRRS